MKAILVAAIAFGLLADTAIAQTAQQPGAMAAQPANEVDQQGDAHMAPPSPRDHHEWERHDGDDMQSDHHRPPPTRAARFRIETGDVTVGMKCPEDEPLKACADFTLQLLDKIAALPRH